MRKLLLYGTLGFALGAGSIGFALSNPFGWSWLPGATGQVMGGGMEMAGAGTPAPAAGERRIKYWQAPMDPTYIRDQPGKSPMGMDLIPVYEDEADTTPGIVTIDPGFVQNIGVQTTHVMRGDIPFTIRTVGNLVHDDSQIAIVTTKYEGWIEKAYINYVGQPVEAGQVLFDVYSPALVSTQQEYLSALDYTERMRSSGLQDMAARADALLDAARRRLDYWDISGAQIEALEASRTPQRTLAVTAPRGGVVVWKMDQALEGMRVGAGMNIYRIADLSTIWAEAEVFESQMPWLGVGQRATIEVPYEPGTRLTGTVRYLYPHLAERTRSLRVSLELPNPGGRLRAGMYVNVTFDVPAARDVLTVPEEAVIHSGTRTVVVLDRGGGTFQVREVELGRNGNGLWEVRQGVEEHDAVVVSAQFLIDSESNLREAIRKITMGASGETSGSAAEPEMPDMPDHSAHGSGSTSGSSPVAR